MAIAGAAVLALEGKSRLDMKGSFLRVTAGQAQCTGGLARALRDWTSATQIEQAVLTDLRPGLRGSVACL